jgi:toxin ParE1/3/4
MLGRVEARFKQVVKLPDSGADRSNLGDGLRVVFFGKYAIYYLPRPDEIIIVRALHGSRDIDSIEDEGGFAV